MSVSGCRWAQVLVDPSRVCVRNAPGRVLQGTTASQPWHTAVARLECGIVGSACMIDPTPCCSEIRIQPDLASWRGCGVAVDPSRVGSQRVH